MIHVAIICAKRTSFSAPDCPESQILWDLKEPELAPGDVRKVLAEHGWVEDAGEYYCPRHRPEDAGIMWDPPFPDGAYHPVANSGWEARAMIGSQRLELRPIRGEATDA
jgi:hypothetical protein